MRTVSVEDWVSQWEKYVETRRCPVCESDAIADIVNETNGVKIENCLDCQWYGSDSGLGHCDHDADDDILKDKAQEPPF